MTADTLETIAADVRGCPACRLARTRTQAVPGEGTGSSGVFFIGEGPGFHEDQQGRPFVGAAGQLLNQMLQLIGLRREEVFITNVVRCRPPGNRDPQPDELAACDQYTLRQIAVLKPRLIVTLGRYSMARFFGPSVRISQIHGQTTTWNGITCIAMYHPAAVLRAATPAMRQAYEADFGKIPALLVTAEPNPPPAEAAPTADHLDQLRLF